MNGLLKTLAIALVCTTWVSCSDSDTPAPDNPTPEYGPDVPRGSIMGEWKLTEWTPSTAMKNGVYVELNEDNTFTLYGENFTTPGYKKQTGTFTYAEAEKKISGKYSDNTLWGNEYTLSLSKDRNTLKWQTVSDPDDVSVYTRTTIPDEVKQTTRSEAADESMKLL